MATAVPPMTAAMKRCAIEEREWRNALLFKNAWSILLFILGVSIATFLVLVIVLWLRQDWVAGSVILLGTIVEGAGVKFLVDLRTQSKTEADAAKDAFIRCRDSALKALKDSDTSTGIDEIMTGEGEVPGVVGMVYATPSLIAPETLGAKDGKEAAELIETQYKPSLF
jgi:hypothetical protein